MAASESSPPSRHSRGSGRGASRPGPDSRGADSRQADGTGRSKVGPVSGGNDDTLSTSLPAKSQPAATAPNEPKAGHGGEDEGDAGKSAPSGKANDHGVPVAGQRPAQARPGHEHGGHLAEAAAHHASRAVPPGHFAASLGSPGLVAHHQYGAHGAQVPGQAAPPSAPTAQPTAPFNVYGGYYPPYPGYPSPAHMPVVAGAASGHPAPVYSAGGAGYPLFAPAPRPVSLPMWRPSFLVIFFFSNVAVCWLRSEFTVLDD